MTTERRFGERLDVALGEGPPETALRLQRANVLAAIRREQRPRGRPRWEFAAVVAAVAVVAVGIAVWSARPRPLVATFRGHAGVGAALLVAAEARAEPIDFSDGSRVLLEPKATASVVRLEPNHTELALKSGKLAASVHHREGATWSILAGPYEVRVVGTKFTVQWDQASQALEVAVTEGRVRVSGGELGPRAVELEPGQRLERHGVRPPAPPTVPRATVPVPSVPAPGAPAPSALPAATSVHAAGERFRSAPAASTAPPAPGVGELAESGKYRDALALAEQQGFERVIGQLPEGELLALGNAARYAGSASRARQAMLALRSRFPGRPASGLAAFYLAKIAEQLDKSPSEAARWLRVFLSESPTGSLAADARASLLSILLASGDTAGATTVARDYLRYHPNGPIADRARALVSRSEGK